MQSSSQVDHDVEAARRRSTAIVAGVVAVLLVARVLLGSDEGLPRSLWSVGLVAVVVVALGCHVAATVTRRLSGTAAQRSLWGGIAVAVLLWQLDAARMLPAPMAIDFQLTWSQNVTGLVLGAYLVLPRASARRAVAGVGLGAATTMVVASRTIDGMPEAWQGTLSLLVVVVLADALAGSFVVMRGHEARARAVAELAYLDELTGLRNRRGTVELLTRLTEGTAVAIVDLDHFKRVNDEHGHDVGDAVLAAVGTALQGALRADDVASRWGGEEFLVMLSGGPGPCPSDVAERLRAAVASCRAPVGVTASVGVAVAGASEPWEDVFRRADAALYAAKAAGRDRVVVADAAAGG